MIQNDTTVMIYLGFVCILMIILVLLCGSDEND